MFEPGNTCSMKLNHYVNIRYGCDDKIESVCTCIDQYRVRLLPIYYSIFEKLKTATAESTKGRRNGLCT